MKKWGINKELLAIGLREECGEKSVNVSIQAPKEVDYLNERNAYGLNPEDGTQREVSEIPIRPAKQEGEEGECGFETEQSSMSMH